LLEKERKKGKKPKGKKQKVGGKKKDDHPEPPVDLPGSLGLVCQPCIYVSSASSDANSSL
jgi:hypothetical protein